MAPGRTSGKGGGAVRARVLYADDDPSMRTLLRVNLEAEGFEVETVGDGHTAYHAAQALRPDLVVLDVMMPGQDGYTVLRSLKENPSTAGIPVVLLTAKATDEEVWEGWKSGADYYITKPFNPEELVHFMEYLFAQEDACA